MSNKLNNIKLALLPASVLCLLASIFAFPFVYSEVPTGSLFDKINFSQLFIVEEGKNIPRLVEELRIFCIIGIGGFCLSATFYSLRLMGKSFKGMALLFILSILIGMGTFLALRLGLSQMISKGAAFGISWYFVYGAFIALIIGFFIKTKARAMLK
jgi:hypothetical protein